MMSRLGWLLLLPLLACELDRTRFELPLQPEGPVTAGGRLHFLDAARSRLLTHETSGEARFRCLPIFDHARGLRAAGDEVWLLGMEERGPSLLAWNAKDGTKRTIRLPQFFDEIVASPKLTHAILLADPSRPPLPGEPAARDVGKIAVVDLETGEARSVPLETGGPARGAVFSEDGETAAILLPRGVLILDVEQPERRRLAHLELSDGTSLRPEEARFSADGKILLVLTDGSSDLLALQIHKAPGDLELSINLLAAPGGAIQVLEVPKAEGLESFVVVGAGKTVSLLHIYGDTTKNVSRSVSAPARWIVETEDGAFLFGGHLTEGSGIALAAWDPSEDLIDQSRVDGVLQDVHTTAGKGIFLHTLESGHGLTVATVERRGGEPRVRLQTFPVSGTPTALHAEGGSIVLGVTVFRETVDESDELALEATRGALVTLELDGSEIRGIDLDAPVEEVGVVGDHLFALHPSPVGDLTLVKTDAPSRKKAIRFEGIFMTELLSCE